EAAWRPKGDHLGRLRRLASCGRQTERGWNATAPCTGAILQVFEQRGRARSSPDKAANPADARIQAIRDGGRDDPRHRTGGENQETTNQPQTTNRKSNHRSGNVGRGLGGLKPGKSFARQKHTLNKLCTRTVQNAAELAAFKNDLGIQAGSFAG